MGRAQARTLEVLRCLYLGRETVAEMGWLANVKEVELREAARAWMRAPPEIVDGWFAER